MWGTKRLWVAHAHLAMGVASDVGGDGFGKLMGWWLLDGIVGDGEMLVVGGISDHEGRTIDKRWFIRGICCCDMVYLGPMWKNVGMVCLDLGG